MIACLIILGRRSKVNATLPIMEITLGRVFVMFFVSCSLSAAFDVKVMNFQILKKHSALRKCPWAVQKNEYVGMRVSELSDECQGLNQSWLLNQTIESGYAYAKKQFMNETFQPPVELKKGVDVRRIIPGGLRTGARVDVFVSKPEHLTKSVSFVLEDGFRGGYAISFEWYHYNGLMLLKEFIPIEWNTTDSTIHNCYGCKQVVKVSYLAQTDSLLVLLDDRKIMMMKPALDMAMLNEIRVDVLDDRYSALNFLYSIQYSLL